MPEQPGQPGPASGNLGSGLGMPGTQLPSGLGMAGSFGGCSDPMLVHSHFLLRSLAPGFAMKHFQILQTIFIWGLKGEKVHTTNSWVALPKHRTTNSNKINQLRNTQLGIIIFLRNVEQPFQDIQSQGTGLPGGVGPANTMGFAGGGSQKHRSHL